jgi:hypothetical protein
MINSVPLTRTHLEQALTKEELRVTLFIRIALMLGICFFYFVVLLIYFIRTTNSYSQPDTSLMDALSIFHIVFTVAMTSVAFYISRLQLRPERLSGQNNLQSSEEVSLRAVNLYRVSSLLLMAPIEAAAFLGAAICMAGIQNGTMGLYPIYWLNVFSAVLFILVGIITFPTRERILETLESSFIQR